MQRVNCTTVNGNVTGATPVAIVVPEFQQAKAWVRRFSAVGNDAGSKVKWYIPRVAYRFALTEKLSGTAVKIKIPVDEAGGKVFKGYTIATTTKLLLSVSGGWSLVSVSAVAQVEGKDYCEATISATGADVPSGTVAYVVRPADLIDGLPAVGANAVSVEDFISGDPGAPLVATIESAAGKTTAAGILVEYWA